MKRPISIYIIVLLLSLIGSIYVYYSFMDYHELKKVSEIEEIIEEKSDVVTNTIQSIEEDLPIGIISIPKINLKRGFYNKDSVNNNVNKNITMLKESIMPDNEISYLLLAAHSGNSYLGFFRNLKDLTLGDEIDITYQKNNYLYYVSDIYEEEKNGHISFKHNKDESILVLTTCASNNRQLIIIAKMKKNG